MIHDYLFAKTPSPSFLRRQQLSDVARVSFV